MATEFIKVNPQVEKHIALIELNRPKELNALSRELMLEIRDTLRVLDEDDNVRVIILTGGEKVFAAGADIKQMATATAIDMLNIDQFSTWDQIKKTKKPIIAAATVCSTFSRSRLLLTDLSSRSSVPSFKSPNARLKVLLPSPRIHWNFMTFLIRPRGPSL